MGFIVGFLFGAALGIGIVVSFAKYQKTRSKNRQDLAETVAAFARMTIEDSRKLLQPEYYPPWVIFSRRQKVWVPQTPFNSSMLNWLNQQLNKIWPYVNEAASEIIRSSVEPILEQYRPVILASLKFSELTLGTVAPQFTGVQIMDSEKGEIIMELDLQWDGNPNIVLDIKTRVGVALPIQVKNIGFTGVFRLIFKPLVDELPCFGAVCYSLREKRNLDFTLKVIGGDISSIPGISDAIEDTIHDAIEDSITWPVRNIIPILPGDYRYLELKPVGILEVKLIQAKELTNKDLVGKSDPFATMYVRPVRDKKKNSKTINNQLNPIWNEHFEFVVEDVSTQHLTIRVYDDEGVQAAEFIGCAQYPLRDLAPGKVKAVWLKLVKDLVVQRDTKNRGEVHLELLYCPFGVENAFMKSIDPDFRLTHLEKALKTDDNENDVDPVAKYALKKKDFIVRGVLSVTVISAENLPAADLMGKSDPFVVLLMKKSDQRKKTRVLNNTLNPIWNQTFDFVIEDGLHDLLMIEVWDHDVFKKDKLGGCIMTLTRVILEGEITAPFNLDRTKSGQIYLQLKWSPQPFNRD